MPNSLPIRSAAAALLLRLLSAHDALAQEPGTGLREGLTLGALVDVYAAVDSDLPANHRRPDYLYAYARTEAVTINLAMLRADYASEHVRGGVGLMAGTFAQDNQGGEAPLLRHVYDAQVGVHVRGGWWVDAGLFPSHLGAESAIGPNNLTLTRSLNAENSPYYLSGVKASGPLGQTLSLTLLGATGWQRLLQVPGRPGAGGGTALTWTPSDTFSANWSTWVGVQQPDSALRVFQDLYVTVVRGPVTLIAWLDVGWQAGQSWAGANLQAQLRLSEPLRLSTRVEHFRDPRGVVATDSGRGVTLSGGSLGLDVLPWPRALASGPTVIWRTELRALYSDPATFSASVGGEAWNLTGTTSLSLSL